MSFKNSTKLLASNFNIVWKHLVYNLIIAFITIGLFLAFGGPLIWVLKDSGWIDSASNIISTIYTDPSNTFVIIKQVALSFFTVVYQNFGAIWYSVIGLIITGYLIPKFLYGVGFYNVVSVTHKQMTSLLSTGYTGNLISTLRTSTKYSIVRLLIMIPFDILRMLLVVAFFRLCSTFFTSLIFLSLLCLMLIMLSGLEITTLAGFAPYMVDVGGNPFKCFAKAIVPIFKSFGKVYSNAIMVTLTIVLVNAFLGVFTAFSALLITLPATSVFIAFFNNVSYLSCTNKRYYLSKFIIVNPTNVETKVDVQ